MASPVGGAGPVDPSQNIQGSSTTRQAQLDHAISQAKENIFNSTGLTEGQKGFSYGLLSGMQKFAGAETLNHLSAQQFNEVLSNINIVADTQHPTQHQVDEVHNSIFDAFGSRQNQGAFGSKIAAAQLNIEKNPELLTAGQRGILSGELTALREFGSSETLSKLSSTLKGQIEAIADNPQSITDGKLTDLQHSFGHPFGTG